jgi:hypothetical protein
MPVYPGAFSVFICGEYPSACRPEYSQLWALSRCESCPTPDKQKSLPAEAEQAFLELPELSYRPVID